MTTWTEGRKRAFITSVLRGGSRRWPPKYETLNAAYVGVRYNEKTKRNGKHYLCAKCQGEFPSAQVQIDHTVPVTDPAIGFISWDVFIDRLYCSKENLMVLCKDCHKIKTKEENKERTNVRKKSATNK